MTTTTDKTSNLEAPSRPAGDQAPPPAVSHDAAVRERYTGAARDAQPALCCAVDYDPRYLEAIPREIVDRDYGCGDPTRHVHAGDRVLDLGSGTGKICYIASQITGPSGAVIGVDVNDDMLALARKHQDAVAQAVGFANVSFKKGRIEDLALDLDLLEEHIATHPVRSSSDYVRLEDAARELRRARPMIADQSVDLVVSNCVLNLVRPDARRQLFAEIHRVLARGGRAVISDIVSDEDVPDHLQRDPELWSGCISGTLREDRFLAAFADAGLYGIEILERGNEPWAIVEGIEFRSMTIRAMKGSVGPGLERHQTVIYTGPWKAVVDEDGRTLHRGERMAVGDQSYRRYTSAPYQGSIIPVPPHETVPVASARPFADGDQRRAAHLSKAPEPRATQVPGSDQAAEPCAPRPQGGGCCGPSTS